MNLAEKQMDRQGPKLQVKYKKGRRGTEQNEGIRKKRKLERVKAEVFDLEKYL